MIKDMYNKAPDGLRVLVRRDAYALFTSKFPYDLAIERQNEMDSDKSLANHIKKQYPTATAQEKKDKFSNFMKSYSSVVKPLYHLLLPRKLMLVNTPEAERFNRYGKSSKFFRYLALGITYLLIVLPYAFPYELAYGINAGYFILMSELLFMGLIFAHEYLANRLTRDIANSPYNKMRMTSYPLLDDLYDEILRSVKAVYKIVTPPNARFVWLWRISYPFRVIFSLFLSICLLVLEFAQAIKTLYASFMMFLTVNLICIPFLINDAYYSAKNYIFGITPPASNQNTNNQLGAQPSAFAQKVNQMSIASIAPLGQEDKMDQYIKMRDDYLIKMFPNKPEKSKEWITLFGYRAEKGVNPNENDPQSHQS